MISSDKIYLLSGIPLAVVLGESEIANGVVKVINPELYFEQGAHF